MVSGFTPSPSMSAFTNRRVAKTGSACSVPLRPPSSPSKINPAREKVDVLRQQAVAETGHDRHATSVQWQHRPIALDDDNGIVETCARLREKSPGDFSKPFGRR